MTVPFPSRPAAERGDLPLHHRFTEEFERLLETHRIEATVQRIVADFLRRTRIDQRSTSLGALRCGLAWQSLPDFLDAGGWSVAGCFGFGRSGDEVDAPAFGHLKLGEGCVLEWPKDVALFLENDASRRVLRFELQRGPFGTGVEITEHAGDGAEPLFEPWFAWASRHNVLRGRNLRAGGRLAGEPGLRKDERLFIDESVRERLDLVARRFGAAHSGRLTELGLRARGGVILAGPPGTGKTSLCRELSGRLDATFLWVTPGDLTDEQEVKEVFALARWLAPTVVVLEDLDLVAESRLRGNRSSVLGQLMSELDGVSGDHPILTLATTNRLDVIEEAVRNRPGRFDQVLEIGPPDADARLRLVAHRFAACALPEGEAAWFAAALEGATGAEIEEAANCAIACAATEASAGTEAPRIERSHLERALAWVQRMPARRGVGFAAND